jgi:hypothetical protein
MYFELDQTGTRKYGLDIAGKPSTVPHNQQGIQDRRGERLGPIT